jgi:hypothetical protein
MIFIGPMGEFPDGKLNSDDGELNVGIGRSGNNVYIEFGTMVRWVAFPPEIAENIAGSLRKFSEMIRKAPELPKNWDA